MFDQKKKNVFTTFWKGKNYKNYESLSEIQTHD